MVRILVIGIFILVSTVSKAGDGDTVKMNFFTKYDLQQWKGAWWHKKFDYINPSKKYKKAFLKIDLGCASYGCCVWDYTFQAYIVKPLSGNDTSRFNKKDTVTWNGVTVVLDSIRILRKSDNYECARLITPYGTYMRAGSNGFDNDWSHPYVFDVTDYLPLLKDSFGIAVRSGGYDPKKGFNMTTDLILIEGEFDAEPNRVLRAYQRSFDYKNETQIDTIISSYKFKLDSDENQAKFRTRVTGHRQHGEFSPIEYYVLFNGKEIYKKRLWRTDCDKTHIQPQGGTWIFSRCNWCPGEKIIDFEIDLTKDLKVTDSNEIRVLFRNLEASATNIEANYIVTGNIITFKSKDSADLVIDEVIAPSNDKTHFLYNSLCQGPRIRLKNNGYNIAKQAYIDYWVDEANKTTHIWKGSLRPDESIVVDLPAFPWDGVDYSNPIFYASLQKHPDNMVVWNDLVSSPFTIPDVYNTTQFKFEVKNTDESINTNTLTITNELGVEVLKNTYPTDNSTHIDTITLADGCYRVELIDYESRYECGDGLNFWLSSRSVANQGLGKNTGSFRIRNSLSNQILKTFNPDFGGKISYQFTVNSKKIGDYVPLSDYDYKEYEFPAVDTPVDSSSRIQNSRSKGWNIFPNPTVDKKFKVYMDKAVKDLTISVFDIRGLMVYSYTFPELDTVFNMDLSHISSGTYFIRISNAKFVDERKFLVK